ncbi:MAG: UMP kinase [Proteobacteria bacterium]|nr:UMP kinase [Pseudomonadota bacterium]
MPSYQRVLLKLSGEALASLDPLQNDRHGISYDMLQKLVADIVSARNLNIDICLVVGGGNIYRGVSGMAQHKIDRCTADSMGMLATVINGIALQNALINAGVPTRLMSAIPMPTVCEPYASHRAVNHLKNGRVVVFAGGTGNPYFTTDTAAVLRASEMQCDLILKATKVKGVYCSDPKHNSDAKFLPHLTYQEVKLRQLKVMDATAIALAQENQIPVAVFSIYEEDGFKKVLQQATEFTLISST